MTNIRPKSRYWEAPDSSASLYAYASDASLYCIPPAEVVCPDTETEAVSVVSRALEGRKPITPRGGGTGLAGGALGRGCIIDCSHLTEIRSISTSGKTVTCQTGIIYSDLNRALKKHSLFFPPDPSSGDSCQIGGMLANNSSGPRSVKYGLTSHYVEELTVVGREGNPIFLKKLPVGSKELESFLSDHPDYRDIIELLSKNRGVILKRWPKVIKNSAGYNLHQVTVDLDKGIVNLPALYIGSEGTLGLFLSVKLRLLPIPDGSRSFRLFFASLEDAGEAVAPLLETKPAGLEIVDGSTLDLIGRARYHIPSEAQAMLLLEYDAGLDKSERALLERLPRLKLLTPPERAANEEQRAALWAARQAIVPTLYRHHQTKRPLPFIEDASLPVAKLPEFIAWIKERLEKNDLTFGLYGHIGDGNLHIRPLLDLSISSDFELMKSLYQEVYEKLFALGGSSTAEHADGRLRSAVLRRLYGDEIYAIFQQVKSILDPQNLFNPDVILSKRPFTDDIDFKKLELTCAACGKCNGYCPAFEIFRREDMSPRGWLRLMKSGQAEARTLTRFYQHCLNCKNCTTICPAGVDIAGEILEFRSGHVGLGTKAAISVFDRKGLFRNILRVGSAVSPLMQTKPARKITALAGHWPFGLDDTAEFPQPARKTLRERFPDRCRNRGQIAFFHGCADNYFVSGAGDALVKVFEHYGWEIVLPPQECCGLPMEVYGHRSNLIEKAKKNLDHLESFEAIVFTCASCLHRVADYAKLFAPDSVYQGKALALKERVFDACQYILKQGVELPENNSGKKQKVSYHHPCHLRAAGLEKEPVRMLSRIKGIDILHPDRAGRCCGQAGSFGYTHYQEGKAIFAPKKKEYEELGAEVIVSSCPACLSQIKKEMGPTIRVCHPVELIADLLPR